MEPVLKPIERIHYRKVIGRNIEQLIQKVITALAYDPIAAASLFLFVLLTRIPFRSQILYHWIRLILQFLSRNLILQMNRLIHLATYYMFG
jgi:hypothetical protein